MDKNGSSKFTIVFAYKNHLFISDSSTRRLKLEQDSGKRILEAVSIHALVQSGKPCSKKAIDSKRGLSLEFLKVPFESIDISTLSLFFLAYRN